MLRLAVCQTPEILGDVDAALGCIEDLTVRAAAGGAGLVVFPECFLQGYLADGHHVRRHALDLASAAFAGVLRRLAPLVPTLVFGVVERRGDRFHNAAVVVDGGRLAGVYRKTRLLPGEAVFTAGSAYPTFERGGLRWGINICHDTAAPGPAAAVAAQGARLLVVPAQNMMRRAAALAWRDRHEPVRAARARETGMWVASADVTGERGTDRVALGPTSILDPRGEPVARVPLGTAGLAIADVGP